MMSDEYFEKLSFEKAVQLFQEWGFLVRPGPGPGEVTLILDETTNRSYCVCQPRQLAEMAEVILRHRLRTSAVRRPVLDIQ
jgi:hypothetical protein